MKLIFVIFTVAGLACSALAQDQPCATAAVAYNRPPADVASKIFIKSTSEKPAGLKRESTIQGTRWLAMAAPDFTKSGPWNTTVFIGIRTSEKPFLKVSISDHGNTLSASWVSEKLLHLTVWWGRIAASDVIVDVEKRSIIYHEVGNYSQLTFCRESQ